MKRVLALDYGQRRIGIALSDPLGLTAQPYDTWQNLRWDEVVDRLSLLIEKEGVQCILIGLPLTLKGHRGKMAAEVQRFADRIKKDLEKPVILWDERLTSVQAKRILRAAGPSVRRRKASVDVMAAVLLLQSYLDSGVPDRSGESA